MLVFISFSLTDLDSIMFCDLWIQAMSSCISVDMKCDIFDQADFQLCESVDVVPFFVTVTVNV